MAPARPCRILEESDERIEVVRNPNSTFVDAELSWCLTLEAQETRDRRSRLCDNDLLARFDSHEQCRQLRFRFVNVYRPHYLRLA